MKALVTTARKALVGAVVAAAAAVTTAAQDGAIDNGEWVTIGGAALAGALAVFYVKNKDA